MLIENLHIDEWLVITNPHYTLCGIPFKIVAIQTPNLLVVNVNNENKLLPIDESMRLTKCNEEYILAMAPLLLNTEYKPLPSKEIPTSYVHIFDPYGFS